MAAGAQSMRDNAMKDESIRRLTASGVLPGQRYQHYRTRAVYLVIAIGLFESDLEPLVHYRLAEDEYGIVWTRHLTIFCGQVAQSAALVPRYTLVN